MNSTNIQDGEKQSYNKEQLEMNENAPHAINQENNIIIHQDNNTNIDMDDYFMELAFEEAELAFSEREVPIGCVFVKNGQVIAKGHNKTNATGNGTLHAEMVAISTTLSSNHNNHTLFQDSTLYVTIEPCIMCASAISQIGIKRAVFGASNDRFGGCGSVLSLHQQKPCYEVVRGIQKERSIQLLQKFYDRENDKAPESKRRKK